METSESAGSPALDAVLSKVRYKVQAGKYMAFCPAHDDGSKNDRPSLHVSRVMGEDGGRVVLHCFAGCPNAEIVERLGITMADLFDHNHEREQEPERAEKPKPKKTGKIVERQRYEMRDVRNNLVAIHVRLVYEGGGKDFSWEKPDGSRGGFSSKEVPLYNSPVIRKALMSETKRVLLVEGEKACDALRAAMMPCVATATGSSTIPTDDVLRTLSGLTVVIWPDDDLPGERHMQKVAERLVALGIDVRWFEWKGAGKKGGDAADHPALQPPLKKGPVWTLAKELSEAPAFKGQANPDSTAKEPERGDRAYDRKRDGAASFSVHRGRFEQYIKAKQEGIGITGIRTGFGKLDALMGGLEKQESTVVAAATSVGKSIFTTQVGVSVSRNAGKRVLIQSTEMAGFIYSKRIAHALSGVPDIRGEEAEPLTQEQIKALREAHEEIESLPLLIDDYKPDIRRIRQNIESHQPDLVIVDHLHRMKQDASKGGRYQEVGKISEELAGLKSDYPDITFLIAAQFSRNIEHRQDKRPTNADIKDAGAVEQDADWTLLLHRPGFYDEQIDNGVLEVYCGKARHGVKFNLMLHQVERQAWFTEKPADVHRRPDLRVVGGGGEEDPPFKTATS